MSTKGFKNNKQFGHVLPNVEKFDGTRFPHAIPAPYLNVKLYNEWVDNWYVILPGQPVAFDSNGYLVPAGLKTDYDAGDGNGVTTYSQDDEDLGVNRATGVAAASGDVLTDYLYDAGITISDPVGVAPMGIWRWAGGDGINPFQFDHTNYNLQSGVTFITDGVIEVPLVPAAASTEDSNAVTQSGDLVVFAAVDNLPMAAITTRTPFTVANGSETDAATIFASRKSTLAEVTVAGAYYVDISTGVVTVYGPGLAAGWAASGAYKFSYYHYAAVPTTKQPYAQAYGTLKPGTFVKVDKYNNYVIDSSPTLNVTLGQIVKIESGHPVQALDKVRTHYSGLRTIDKTVGSATGGAPASISLTNAADTLLWINLITR